MFYSVNHNYVNQQGAGWKLVTENPEDKDQTNTINTPDQQFQVIATKVDPATGFDGMAVAPIVNGTPNLFLAIMKMPAIFSIMEIRRLK